MVSQCFQLTLNPNHQQLRIQMAVINGNLSQTMYACILRTDSFHWFFFVFFSNFHGKGVSHDQRKPEYDNVYDK